MKSTQRKLPEEFLSKLERLAESYLSESDPIRQSGFGGGAKRWRSEREPILDAIDSDGDLLDVGCANGYLLECLVKWGREKGLSLVPYGLDISDKLIELAKERLPENSKDFFMGNAWDWKPPRKFKYVYTLYDCVPLDFLEEYINRLLVNVVSPGGRLIIGAYGSISKNELPFDIVEFLNSINKNIAGYRRVGNPDVVKIGWIDNR